MCAFGAENKDTPRRAPVGLATKALATAHTQIQAYVVAIREASGVANFVTRTQSTILALLAILAHQSPSGHRNLRIHFGNAK